VASAYRFFSDDRRTKLPEIRGRNLGRPRRDVNFVPARLMAQRSSSLLSVGRLSVTVGFLLVLSERAAWAHGEQLLINFGVTVFLLPVWAWIARWQIQRLPEEVRRGTWAATVLALVGGVVWALFGSNLISDNAFVGPALSFGALSIAGAPCAIALWKNGRRAPAVALVGVPVVFGLLFSIAPP